MTKLVSDILAGGARILHAPIGSQMPEDSVAPGASFPTGWVELGYTKAPTKLTYEFDIVDFMVQESLAPVGRRKTKENCSFETTLAQMSMDEIAIVHDGLLTTTAAGADQPGKDEVEFGDNPFLTENIWCIEGSYMDDDTERPVRIFIYRGTAVSGGETEFSKEDYNGVPFKIGALSDLTKAKGKRLFKIQRITADATA